MYTCPTVRISSLRDDEIETIATFLAAIAPELVKAPMWPVVRVRRASGAYLRRAPGAVKLQSRLGAEAFNLFGTLVGLGLEVVEQRRRSDLTGSQRIGRASLELTPIRLLLAGASLIAPEETDRFKNSLFAGESVHVQALSDAIVRLGGRPFQEWSSKPHWIDFM
jgi:hypothetical protein